MAKTRVNNKRKSKGKRGTIPKMVQRIREPPGISDREAYKRLLLDPCYSALPPSPYTGNSGSAIRRIKYYRSNSAAYDITFYHPSYGMFYASDATGNVATTIAPVASQQVSGRAIAGCISATYYGAESSRQGAIFCGVVPGNIVSYYLVATSGGQGSTMALSGVQSLLSHVERTPVDKCEVNWVPGEGDYLPVKLTYDANHLSQIQDVFARTNFCVILVARAASSDTIAINTTSVVEDFPETSGGPVWDTSIPVKPKFDYKAVIEELARKDSSWFLNTFKKTAMLVGGTVSSYMTAGLPGALGYLTSQAFGLNTSVPRKVVRSAT